MLTRALFLLLLSVILNTLPAHAGTKVFMTSDVDDEMIILDFATNQFIRAKIIQDSCSSPVSDEGYGIGPEMLQLLGNLGNGVCTFVGKRTIANPSQRLTKLTARRDKVLMKYTTVTTKRAQERVRERGVDLSVKVLKLGNIVRYHTGREVVESEKLVFTTDRGRDITVVIYDDSIGALVDAD